MLIQASAGFGMLYRLDLTKAAQDLLSALVERQEPGGEVNASQAELGARVGLSRNSANTAMALLESRNLVLRPEDRKYRTYYLHPYIASYSSQRELEDALQDAAERISAGELPDITAPLYETAPPKRQPQALRAVRAAG
jgi:predicted transcriptional regulator